MKSLERIFLVYEYLKKKQSSLDELLMYLKTHQHIISKRQLQRDIAKISFLLNKGEELVKYRDSKNNLILKIYVLKSVFNVEKPFDLKTLNTQFSELKITDTKKDFFFNLSLNSIPIKILKIENDFTSENHNFETRPLYFLPLTLINHRLNDYIAGYNMKKKTYQIFELSQIKEYNVLKYKKKYPIKDLKEGFKKHFLNRFGVTKNTNDQVYRIKLLFSSATGSYIQKRIWHSSQKFKKQNGLLEMTLKCGINRELLGWLNSWMYNVKILGPPELIEYYNKSLKEVLDLNSKLKPLVYKNLFTQ
jgi:hypothetical protein